MSTRNQFKRIQGNSTRWQGGAQDYESWQNLIEDECGVQCTVKVDLKAIQIRTITYADYCLVASVVRKRTSLEVVRG